MLCKECEKRNSCRSLCKAAEKYVDQDRVGNRDSIEYVNGEPEIFSWGSKEVLVDIPRGNSGERMSESDYFSMLEEKNGTWVDYMREGTDFQHPALTPLANLVVNLYHVEGMKWREISKVVEEKTGRKMSKDAIKNMLFHARRRVKSTLSA